MKCIQAPDKGFFVLFPNAGRHSDKCEINMGTKGSARGKTDMMSDLKSDIVSFLTKVGLE